MVFRYVAFALLCVLGSSVAHSEARSRSSFLAAESLYATSTYSGNAYGAGASVVLTSSVPGDFSAFGGSVVTAAPIGGDALLTGGSLSVRAPITGDVRALGGSLTFDGAVRGDLIALGYEAHIAGRPEGSVLVAALTTNMSAGAGAPVTIYGNSITLSGVFDDDVHLIASGRVVLTASTTIHGSLSYESPERAVLPPSVVVDGGVHYTNASYLPTFGTSRVLGLINLGFFLLVRFLGALILAGLLAGLFPRLAQTVVEEVHAWSVRSALLTTLLGFGIGVATPILIALLLLTFVGIGLALLLGILYLLLSILAVLYAAIVVGSVCARHFLHRETVLWHDGVLGMAILLVVSLVPVVGVLVVWLVTLSAMGILLQLFYRFAFSTDRYTTELL